jgi:hypothetical protein
MISFKKEDSPEIVPRARKKSFYVKKGGNSSWRELGEFAAKWNRDNPTKLSSGITIKQGGTSGK